MEENLHFCTVQLCAMYDALDLWYQELDQLPQARVTANRVVCLAWGLTPMQVYQHSLTIQDEEYNHPSVINYMLGLNVPGQE